MAVPVVLVGPPVGTPSTNISAYIDFATLVTEDTGNQADDTATFELLDIDLDVSDLAPNGRILVTQDGHERFNGFITQLEPAWEGISRRFRVSCTGISHLLDMCIIPPSGSAYVRNNSESDKQRIQWLLNTFGDPFLDAGSSSFTYIQALEPDMPKQNFANLTLRQAIERVLGAASESANYYIDTLGRLHTWDNDNEEAAVAPFDIVTTPTLAATEVAPSDLRVMWDTSELVNFYYVRGKNAAGSGPESDATSIATYGRWQAFIDGPDSDTTKKARRLGRAALKDTKNPIIRTSFTVEADYCENGDGEIWRPGQQVLITSPAHGMTGYEIRVIRVTTSYLNGLGDRRMEIECGALRANFLGPDQWGTGPANYPDPTLVIQPGPPVIDGPVTPSGADTGPAVLDDFARELGTPIAIIAVTSEVTVDYTGGDSAVSIPLPIDDANAGDHLVALILTEPFFNIQTEIEGQGWEQLLATVGSNWWVRRIDGSEDDVLEFVILSETPAVVAVVMLLRNAYDEFPSNPGLWFQSNPGNTTNPDSLAATSDWEGEPALFLTSIQNDGTAITAGPSGYDLVGEDDGTDVRIRVDSKLGTKAAEDAGAYTTSGVDAGNAQASYALAIRGGGISGWGSIPEPDGGVPWEGGNTYQTTLSTGSADVYVDGDAGIIDITADHTQVRQTLTTDADLSSEPWGPWVSGDAAFLIRWKVNPLGDTADVYANLLEFGVSATTWAAQYRINLGDDIGYAYMSPTQQRGLVILQEGGITASDFVPKTLVADTWYYTRIDFRGTQARMKLWLASAVEPAAWDIDVAKIDYAADASDFYIGVNANDTMLFSFEQIDAEAPSTGGVVDKVINHGTGVGPFSVDETFSAGTLHVWVDDIPVIPATQDAVAGTFTLPGTVYHDAGAHPAGCAVLRVWYEKA